MTEPCPVWLLVLDMPAEWRGRFVPFSLIAERLSLSEVAVREALFARACPPGVYFADVRDSATTKTHVASGSWAEPPRPRGVRDLGDRVTEDNLIMDNLKRFVYLNENNSGDLFNLQKTLRRGCAARLTEGSRFCCFCAVTNQDQARENKVRCAECERLKN
jgi:hypothetical protein